ncbi:protein STRICTOSIDINE SYNTHASE-LIKE 11-like [Diospyros lotus]|uniref:protein STRICTOSIDINE SYNTHASE-LIKE 11-like n=1 Tax=Diospyros lotus TaxID=55363 RepID=UPI00224C8681|nr:protein STRICTOSIDINE SYNTHASE-LIKE 11-like [Diospyros lotus]
METVLSRKTVLAIMLSILIFLFSSPIGVLSQRYSTFSSIPLPPRASAPVTLAFDVPLVGGALYVGVGDGRILKKPAGPTAQFSVFATTSPRRSNGLCDGTTDPNLGPICGKPFGLRFNYLTRQLYIADAYLGLSVVGQGGGLATSLATGADGVPFRFLTSIDVSQISGMVYLTDASLTFDLRNITDPNFERDSTGRLISYNPRTRESKVLLTGLGRPTGVAVSLDGSFLLIAEYNNRRIQRFWLTGLRANTVETFLNLPGNPVNIRMAGLTDFWVAMRLTNQQPPLVTPLAQRINIFGMVLAQVNFSAQYQNMTVSVVIQQNGALYTGSRRDAVNFVGVYR